MRHAFFITLLSCLIAGAGAPAGAAGAYGTGYASHSATLLPLQSTQSGYDYGNSSYAQDSGYDQSGGTGGYDQGGSGGSEGGDGGLIPPSAALRKALAHYPDGQGLGVSLSLIQGSRVVYVVKLKTGNQIDRVLVDAMSGEIIRR